jgi:hypothetical protein
MVEPGIVLLGLGAGAAFAAQARARRPAAQRLTRLSPDELGLAEFPPLGAFVQFSAPASPACRISLNRLAGAVAPHRDRATVIELHRRPPGVEALPTVVYVDATGTVLRRWSGAPAREELSELLGRGTATPATAARCSPAAAR